MATVKDPCPPLEADADGMPMLTEQPCSGNECNACAEICPTNAIGVTNENGGKVTLDLGACIGCQLCVDICPTGTITNDRSTKLAKRRRNDLILSNKSKENKNVPVSSGKKVFKRSLHARVVSTGCSACDLEIGATSNPIFDLERFGVHIVASPRFADALIVTGPVGKGMRDSLLRCYAAMPILK